MLRIWYKYQNSQRYNSLIRYQNWPQRMRNYNWILEFPFLDNERKRLFILVGIGCYFKYSSTLITKTFGGETNIIFPKNYVQQKNTPQYVRFENQF